LACATKASDGLNSLVSLRLDSIAMYSSLLVLFNYICCNYYRL
jgi:hypothetical protein